jgi:uncharacterized membrane protein
LAQCRRQDELPDYRDFFYCASVIGTSGQSADVSFVSKPMRRICSLQRILANLFSTKLLALPMNQGQYYSHGCK